MDKFDELVHLYLRLNGFFTVPNYILQNPDQWTDIDVFGVRFPRQEEVLGRTPLRNDPDLALSSTKVDVILAEAKRNGSTFNSSWRDRRRMHCALRFLGLLDADSLEEAAERLALWDTFENEEVRIRPLLCSGEPSMKDDAVHRRLDGIVSFIVRRFRRFRRFKSYRPMWQGTLADEICTAAENQRRPLTLEDVELLPCERRNCSCLYHVVDKGKAATR